MTHKNSYVYLPPKDHKMDSIKCAGVIVIDLNIKKVILVKNIIKRYNKEYTNYSFPKGKIERGETKLAAATRELKEETGLDVSEIKVVKDKCIVEASAKGNPSIMYYIATTNSTKPFTFDPEEIVDVSWCSFEEAKSLLVDKRKKVLEEAFEIFSDEDIVYLEGKDFFS